MVGHKLGEFAPTRQFAGHTPADKKAAAEKSDSAKYFEKNLKNFQEISSKLYLLGFYYSKKFIQKNLEIFS